MTEQIKIVPGGQVGIGEGRLKMVLMGKDWLFFLGIFVEEEEKFRQFPIFGSFKPRLEL